MTEHKYTDEEVIRALELHSQEGEPCTNKCPYGKKGYCGSEMAKDALDLINRQIAEIEMLTKNSISTKYPNCVLCSKGVILTKSLEDYDKLIGDISAEAVKEFAERLETALLVGGIYPVFVKNTIHKLVKEMTGKKECPDCEYFVGCEAACGGVPCDSYTEGAANAK